MINFKNAIPVRYHDCFEDSNKLKQYLKEPEFLHAIENLLYYSQEYYFYNDPDYLGEFLLMYRDTLIRSLYVFEYRGIRLESYIGFLLKSYRKNFYKIKNIEQKRDCQVFTTYGDKNIDLLLGNDYTEKMHERRELYISEKLPSRYLTQSSLYIELEEIKSKMLIAAIEKIRKEVGQSFRRRILLDEKIIIRILLVCSQEYLNPNNISQLLQKALWSYKDFIEVVQRRDKILYGLRLKKNESYRNLHHSYLKYRQSQELHYRARDDVNRVPAELAAIEDALTKRYNTFLRLQKRYLSVRTVLAVSEVSELCNIPIDELKKYYRYLRKYMHNISKSEF